MITINFLFFAGVDYFSRVIAWIHPFMDDDVLEAMKQVTSEGKASWISSPRSLTHWVIGQKTARLARENKAVENSMAQSENVVLPAWMKSDYENVG